MKEIKNVICILFAIALSSFFSRVIFKSFMYLINGDYLHLVASLVWLIVIVFIEVLLIKQIKKYW